MRLVIVVQARMSSTRLPGKVLSEVLGKPLLEYQVERLRRVELVDDIVIATTKNKADDRLVAFCDSIGVGCFRGDEEDVLARYYHACVKYRADAVVRVTADCPLMDPAVVDRVIRAHMAHATTPDYTCNTLNRTYPRGLDCEVISAAGLERAHRRATERLDREHVTRYFYQNPELFEIVSVTYRTDASAHRWTVDTPEDLELIRRILEFLYPEKPEFTMEDCLALTARHPELSEINRHIEQK